MTPEEVIFAVEKEMSRRKLRRRQAEIIRDTIIGALNHHKPIRKPRSAPPSPHQVIKLVADISDIHIEEIRGRNKRNNVAASRLLCMYLLRREFPVYVSYKDIGRMLGRRDHTTVIYGVRKIESLMQVNDPLICSLYARFKAAYQPIPAGSGVVVS